MQKEYKNSLEVNIMFAYYGPGFIYGAWSPCGDAGVAVVPGAGSNIRVPLLGCC